MSASDRSLVTRLLDGDPAALEEFFGHQVPRLYRFARRRLGGRPDLADEVVQDTLVKIIDKLDGFRGDSALSTWMCTVCWRVIQDSRARDRRIPEVPLTVEGQDSRAADPRRGTAKAADPESAFLQEESAHRVHEVLDALPEPYGDVLEWKYIEGQPVKAIARRLGVSPKAAESTLGRARAAFRKAFESGPTSSLPSPGARPS